MKDLKNTYLKYSEEITKEVFDRIIKKLESLGWTNASIYNYNDFEENKILTYSNGNLRFGIYDESVATIDDVEIQVSDILGEDWNKQPSESLSIDDLIEGEYYAHWSPIHDYCYIWINSSDSNHYLSMGGLRQFFSKKDRGFNSHWKTRRATKEERQWLDACIAANKFIPKEEALKQNKEWYKSLKDGDFIVSLTNNLPFRKKDSIYKVRDTSFSYILGYVDENNINRSTNYPEKEFRQATPEEAALYRKHGKPVSIDLLKEKKKEPVMDKEALLEEAKRRYPIGTKYRHIESFTEYVSDKIPYVYQESNSYDFCIAAGKNKGLVYGDGKWAEIISKPEETSKSMENFYVKVNSQKQANNMLDWLESKGEKIVKRFEYTSSWTYVTKHLNRDEWLLYNTYRDGIPERKYEEFFPSTKKKAVMPIPINSKVLYRDKIAILLGYNTDKKACVIESETHGAHDGNMKAYWYDEYLNPIPYIKGKNRYFVSINEISLYEEPKTKKFVKCETQEQWNFVSEKLGRTSKVKYRKCGDCIKLSYPDSSEFKSLTEAYTFQEWCDLNNYTFNKTNESELDVWLRETKAKKWKNVDNLRDYIGNGTRYHIWESLEGEGSMDKAEILWDKWYRTPKEPSMNTYGLNIGDHLPQDIINKWGKLGNNSYRADSSRKWKEGRGFIGDRTIKAFKMLDGIIGFLVSDTAEVYLKAEGFKEFMLREQYSVFEYPFNTEDDDPFTWEVVVPTKSTIKLVDVPRI